MPFNQPKPSDELNRSNSDGVKLPADELERMTIVDALTRMKSEAGFEGGFNAAMVGWVAKRVFNPPDRSKGDGSPDDR